MNLEQYRFALFLQGKDGYAASLLRALRNWRRLEWLGLVDVRRTMLGLFGLSRKRMDMPASLLCAHA